MVVINKIITKIAGGAVPQFPAPVYMTLISTSPLKFQLDSDKNIKAFGGYLVVPKYRKFLDTEIGHKFVFQRGEDGQTYFYLYEPSDPQGSNGIPYQWKGEIESCNLIGTCPDGEVVVTHGTIEVAIHEEGIR